MTRTITGYCKLKKHLLKIKLPSDTKCRLSLKDIEDVTTYQRVRFLKIKIKLKHLLLACLLGLWLLWIWSRRIWYRFAFEYPGVFGFPILGIYARVKGLKYMIPAFTKLFTECKQYTICVWVGLYPVILSAEPEFIEKVLSSSELLNKGKVLYRPVLKLFGGGLIASAAENWHNNRKVINPSFNHKVLVSFLPVFHKAKNVALDKFDNLVGTGEQKLNDMLQRISLGVSVETTMGKVMKEGDQVDDDLAKKFTFVLKETTSQIVLAFLNLDWLYGINTRFKKIKQYLREFVNELIVHKLDILAKAEETTNLAAPTNPSEVKPDSVLTIKKTPNIFIDQAIKIYQKHQISWHDIIAESNTIVTASFETTANSIFSALVMLAMHPGVQEQLYEEIVNVFPEPDFQMEYEHMKYLPYLDMVINEVLRLTPSVPFIGRHVIKDTQLTKDLLLPKGLQIIISIYHLHRRTDIWGPNAKKFNPDNFLPENMSGKHSHAFIPFSKGTRNCIGWRYAIMAMKVMLAGLVRNYRFTTTYKYEELKWVEQIALKYLDEPGIEVHRR